MKWFIDVFLWKMLCHSAVEWVVLLSICGCLGLEWIAVFYRGFLWARIEYLASGAVKWQTIASVCSVSEVLHHPPFVSLCWFHCFLVFFKNGPLLLANYFKIYHILDFLIFGFTGCRFCVQLVHTILYVSLWASSLFSCFSLSLCFSVRTCSVLLCQGLSCS